MSSNNKISNFVNSQVPFFVRNDHRTFVAFLEAYYEYLEQEGKVVDQSRNLQNYTDTDRTITDFATHIENTYLHDFPKGSFAGDKSTIIKNIKDFYRAKGTEKSVKFLMRAIFGEDVDFYYPKKDVLKASDGKWYIQKSLRVTDTQVSNVANNDIVALEKYIGRRVTGATSNAFATVERVDRFYQQGTQIDELILTNIKGTFEDGESVSTPFNENEDIKIVKSNVYGSVVNSITIINAGSRYNVGDPVIIVSSSGTGACAVVGRVSTGNVASIAVINGGAGYQNNNLVLISGGGGAGANAKVDYVELSEFYHPRSYNLVISLISSEANTPINNTKYSNLVSSITDPANAWVQNSMSTFRYSNTGPASAIAIIAPGSGYIETPSISILANTRVKELGIVGRLDIIDGGFNYANGSKIEIINVPGGYGTGARANVSQIHANGKIKQVTLEANTGFIVGGSGYDINFLPTANVITSTGNGANIQVTALTILSGGSGYITEPTVDLTTSGDGTATANASVVRGVFAYPGRYLNDDGHLSSYNFLQDRDYYQNFSYVVRVKESIENYRKILKDLVHPAGMKLFGEYLLEDNGETMTTSSTAESSQDVIFKTGTYTSNAYNVQVTLASHGIANSSNVYLEFLTGYLSNQSGNANGMFLVVSNTTNTFNVVSYRVSNTTSGSVSVGKIVT
jgi:hypothetical protein